MLAFYLMVALVLTEDCSNNVVLPLWFYSWNKMINVDATESNMCPNLQNGTFSYILIPGKQNGIKTDL